MVYDNERYLVRSGVTYLVPNIQPYPDITNPLLWNNYSIRKFQMLTETNSTIAPWTIIRSDHKKSARIACIRYILQNLEYNGKIRKKELIPDPKIVISGIDEIRLMEENLLKPGSMPG